MRKQTTIQMPFSFVTEVLCLIWRLEESSFDSDTAILCKSIESQIQDKIDAMIRREIFTKYKDSTLGSEERENFRRQYLELAGIHKDWVSDMEINS
jgi:hypothetical protein